MDESETTFADASVSDLENQTAFSAETESTEATEAVVMIDYTPVIVDCTSVLSNMILCGALMVLGCLIAFKMWEDHK